MSHNSYPPTKTFMEETTTSPLKPSEENKTEEWDSTHALLKRYPTEMALNDTKQDSFLYKASFMTWTVEDAMYLLQYHPIPCAFALSLLYFMAVEYTLSMVSPSSPPYDIGFQMTQGLHRLLAAQPSLNTLFAALNTVFVGMQTTYILWAWVIEGRPRATIAALFMFTCRGILGYSTQLPMPQEFLGSGADFPVGNASFFLFFSGHVGGSVIASIDMQRMGRSMLAWMFDLLNVMQVMRLLATRGHYTIDLAVGVGAGILCDYFAGMYLDSKSAIFHLFQKRARVLQ